MSYKSYSGTPGKVQPNGRINEGPFNRVSEVRKGYKEEKI